MKGHENVISLLNDLLSDELSAISQYMVHSEMCANWEFKRLHEIHEKRAIDEMKHAEKLIARILFLEGQPIVSNMKPIKIGARIEEQIKNDLNAEVEAVQAYNEGIQICMDHKDNGTREIIEDILQDEEAHLDWLEAQLDQIDKMGLPIYLLAQIEEK